MEEPEIKPLVQRAERSFSTFQKFSYGVGHFINDTTTSVWFNYALLFLIDVQKIPPVDSGLILLLGQGFGAFASPLVGIISDKINPKFGKRKICVLIGAILVNLSFILFMSPCILCHFVDSKAIQVTYYSLLAIIFNIGSSAMMVSHMALVPEMTRDDSERVSLNSYRYAAGISANLFVYSTAWILIARYRVSTITFSVMGAVAVIIGDALTFLFFIFIDEKSIPQKGKCIYLLKRPSFYKVGILYSLARLLYYSFQTYMPFYLEYYLHIQSFHDTGLAEIPIVIMVSSFISTTIVRSLTRKFSIKFLFFLGAVGIVLSSLFLFFIPPTAWWLVYLVSILIGAGTSTLVLTAISMEANLVGECVETAAFVYGMMTFFDKFLNGVVAQVASPFAEEYMAIRLIVLLLPAIGATIGGIVVWV